MASSIKVVLRQKKNKDGSLPLTAFLALRITKDRKASFIYLCHKIKASEWDAEHQLVNKNHPNHVRLNNFIRKKLTEATDTYLDLEAKKKETSSHAVKQKINPSSGLTFFGIAKLYLERLQTSDKYNQYTADKPRIGHFKEFLNDRDIAFSDITESLIMSNPGLVGGILILFAGLLQTFEIELCYAKESYTKMK